MTYIFSVRPKTFEKIRDLIYEKTRLGKLRISDMSDEEGSKVVHREMEVESKILKILQESGEKYEYFEREKYEYTVVGGFEAYLEESESISNFKKLAAPPEWIETYWKKIQKLIKEKNLKKLAIQDVVKEDGFDEKPMPEIFDRWISIVKHAAENGNWYYVHVD